MGQPDAKAQIRRGWLPVLRDLEREGRGWRPACHYNR